MALCREVDSGRSRAATIDRLPQHSRWVFLYLKMSRPSDVESSPTAVEGHEEWTSSKRFEVLAENAPTALPSDRWLQVRPDMAEFAPQVRESTSTVVPDAAATCSPLNTPLSQSSDESLEKHPQPLICGIRRRFLWSAMVIAFLLVAGIVVGATLGGIYGARKSLSAPAPATESTSTTSTAQSTTTASAPSAPAPSYPFDLQVWSSLAFSGSTQKFTRPGAFKTAFKVRSYRWIPGDKFSPFCSVTFCTGTASLGWRGGEPFNQTGYTRNETWGPDNLTIECQDRGGWQEPRCAESPQGIAD